MRITRELVGAFVLMIVVFLIVSHATGSARIVGALGGNLSQLARTFQGR